MGPRPLGKQVHSTMHTHIPWALAVPGTCAPSFLCTCPPNRVWVPESRGCQQVPGKGPCSDPL